MPIKDNISDEDMLDTVQQSMGRRGPKAQLDIEAITTETQRMLDELRSGTDYAAEDDVLDHIDRIDFAVEQGALDPTQAEDMVKQLNYALENSGPGWVDGPGPSGVQRIDAGRADPYPKLR